MIPFIPENIEKLILIVCDQRGVDPTMLLFHTRKREIVEARQLVAYFLFKKFERRSLQKIGNIIGKDHSTVLHCLKTVERLKEVDKDYSFSFDSILGQVALIGIENKQRRRNIFLPIPSRPKRGILRRSLNRKMRLI
jgi:hypothetical protein